MLQSRPTVDRLEPMSETELFASVLVVGFVSDMLRL